MIFGDFGCGGEDRPFQGRRNLRTGFRTALVDRQDSTFLRCLRAIQTLAIASDNDVFVITFDIHALTLVSSPSVCFMPQNLMHA
jgi:hypothetical protein